MTPTNLMTILLGGVVAALPQISGLIPQPYQACVTAAVAMLGYLYHLYTPAPGAPPPLR